MNKNWYDTVNLQKNHIYLSFDLLCHPKNGISVEPGPMQIVRYCIWRAAGEDKMCSHHPCICVSTSLISEFRFLSHCPVRSILPSTESLWRQGMKFISALSDNFTFWWGDSQEAHKVCNDHCPQISPAGSAPPHPKSLRGLRWCLV